MTELRRYQLPVMDEVILGMNGTDGAPGAKLALMHWSDGSDQRYGDNPVKLVFYVADPVAVVESIRADGLEITVEPAARPELGGIVIAFARDPDGYVVELLDRPVVPN